MYRHVLLLAAGLLFTVSAPTCIEAQSVDGNWVLRYLSFNGTVEHVELLVQLKTVDGKITGQVIGTRNFADKKSTIAQEGDLLRIHIPGGKSFEAPIPKTPGQRWPGNMTISKYAVPAWLSATSATRLDGETDRTHVCPPMQEAVALRNKASDLARAKKGGKLTEEQKKRAAQAAEVAKKETPRLYREVLVKFPDDPVIFDAILNLMRDAQAIKATLDEVKGWGAMADKAAKAYGPTFETGFAIKAAAALEGQDAYAVLAVDYARRVERARSAKAPLQEQIDALESLGRALRNAGQNDEAKVVEARIARLEERLDRDYLATLPAVEAFAGRKSKSDRAVLVELFTNPRTGNDNTVEEACSLLLKTYKPSEVIFAHYGLYSSGGAARGPVLTSGPLTNPDARARFAYFNKAFPIEARSESVTFFNGYPKKIARFNDLQAMHKAFCGSIEPLLEENARATLAAKAVRNGDKIDIDVKVSGLANPGADKKLRIVMVQEFVRYPGQKSSVRDAVRLHPNVVRACPGGVAGAALTEPDSKHSVSISLDELRGQIAKGVENLTPKVRNSKLASLLVLEQLRVIAFVQDDSTREILQAVQVEVK